MLLRNLTLTLGLIGTSLTGSVIVINNNNQNNLKTSQNQIVGLSQAQNRELTNIVRELTNWNSLWNEIANNLKFIEPGLIEPGSYYTPDDVKDNIANLKEYLSIDDDFTNQHVGILNPAKEMQATSKSILAHQYVLNNDTDFEQTLYVPSRNYNLTDSASWEFVDANADLREGPLTEKLSFMWEDQKINIDLRETKTGFSSKETQQIYPLQEIKTKPHSKTLFRGEIINHQTAIRGNILYSLNIKGLHDYVFFRCHLANGHTMSTTYNLLEALDTIRKKNAFGDDTDIFQPATNNLIVYKDNQYFYSFPIMWVNNTQSIETHIISK